MPETSTPAEAGVTVEPTLPGLELPEYHGRKPSGMRSRMTGGGNRITRVHEIDDKVVFLVEARLESSGHKRVDDELVYDEGFKILDVFEIAGKAGTRLLSSVRQAYRSSEDTAGGKKALALGEVDLSDDDGVATDGSGVVLTETELAEIRDDPLRAIVDDRTSPVVVVFSDGARQLWPDEFDPGETRPLAGDRFEAEEGNPVGYVYVERLLDAETGETVAQWTEEQEDARLAELERAAEAEESKAPFAFVRYEYPDGSVDEDEASRPSAGAGGAEKMARASRVVGVKADGTEVVLKDRDPHEPAPAGEPGPFDGPAEIARAGDAPDDELEADEFHAEGCALSDDHEGDCEDADGYVLTYDKGNAEAEVVPFPEKPGPEHYAYVDRKEDAIKTTLAHETDRARVLLLVKAEEDGRGRGLKPRKGVLELLNRRAAELFSAIEEVPKPDLANPAGFEPGEDAAEFGDLNGEE